MGEVIYLERATGWGGTASVALSLRQPKGHPVSQFVSLGTALDNLLAKLERNMNERAITKP